MSGRPIDAEADAEAADAEMERLAAEEGLCLTPADTTGGFVGVKRDKRTPSPQRKCFQAQINIHGKLKYLGSYFTAKEAALAYARAAAKFGPLQGHRRLPIREIGASDVPLTAEQRSQRAQAAFDTAATEGLTLMRSHSVLNGITPHPQSSGYLFVTLDLLDNY